MTAKAYPLGAPVPGWQPAGVPTGARLSGRLTHVRRLVASDAAPLFARLAPTQAPQDWLYMPVGPFADEAAFGDWLGPATAATDPLFHAMVGADDDVPFGFCAFLNIRPETGSIEIGFIQLAPGFQRSTAFTEAMYLMAKHAFEQGYRRYEWKCDALNLRSRRAAHRLGFSYEGLFRQHLVVKGRNRDTKWFSIIDSEWPALDRRYARWLDPANFDGDGRQKTSLSALTAPRIACHDPDLPPAREKGRP